MPNQWVRFTEKNYPNFGKVRAVRRGPPHDEYVRDSWTGELYRAKAYTVVHLGDSIVGPNRSSCPVYCVTQSDCELLGPDECARLDAEHGMTGKESES